MPAWGKSMDEEYIWNMAAFLQVLPTLDEGEYQAMVARSGGHSHGGGETKPHADGEGVPANHHDQATEAAGHEHPPGTPPHDDAPAQPGAAMEMGDDHHEDDEATRPVHRSDEHTSELQSLNTNSDAV